MKVSHLESLLSGEARFKRAMTESTVLLIMLASGATINASPAVAQDASSENGSNGFDGADSADGENGSESMSSRDSESTNSADDSSDTPNTNDGKDGQTKTPDATSGQQQYGLVDPDLINSGDYEIVPESKGSGDIRGVSDNEVSRPQASAQTAQTTQSTSSPEANTTTPSKTRNVQPASTKAVTRDTVASAQPVQENVVAPSPDAIMPSIISDAELDEIIAARQTPGLENINPITEAPQSPQEGEENEKPVNKVAAGLGVLLVATGIGFTIKGHQGIRNLTDSK